MSDVSVPVASVSADPVAGVPIAPFVPLVGNAVVRRREGFWGRRGAAERPKVNWLCHGYLAARQVTLLTALWKSGKTTLLSILLERLKAGGELAGQAVTPAKAVVVSEESREQWEQRIAKLDLEHVYFLCRPFAGKPVFEEWLGLLDDIDQLRQKEGVGFVAFDTIASLVPGSESNSVSVMRALLPLQRLTEQGMAVLLTHHPKKGMTQPGQAARGSGAFAAFADIVVEMSRCPHAREDDRRRRLLGFARSEATPRQLVLELNAEATDYACLGNFIDDDFLLNWDRLRFVLEDAHSKLTRREILEQWPADFPRPADNTLWMWLDRAVALGQLAMEGTGRKSDPFRYWLKTREEEWKKDPLYEFNRMCDESFKRFQEEQRRKGIAG
jgi:AAA domain